MKYEARCACGKKYPVGTADAGVSFPCACGRTVDVPALHQLRASAGERSLLPLMQIQSGFLSGELPGPPICAHCGRDTTRQILVQIVCEQGASGLSSVAGQVVSGCFMFALMLVTGIFVFTRNGGAASGGGSGLTVGVPIFLCEGCDRSVTTVPSIRKALNVTPAYATLLERYPNALVRRVS